MLYKYIAEQSMRLGTQFQFQTATLKDFLSYDAMRGMVGKTIAFIAVDRTLADSKTNLDSVTNYQDVFVTEHGKSDEKVLGWVTNVEIAKRASL
jgi:hypothetical protein